MTTEGVFTALVTPFQSDGTIDHGLLRELVDFQIESGVTGLLPMGTSGESPTLSHGEHIRAIETVIDEAAGRVTVIAGSGSNSTDEAIEMTQQAMECGADISLQVAPYYNKPTPEGFYQHFTKIADTVDIPQMIYNIPGRTGKNIDNKTMLRLAGHPNIISVKEASGDLNQVMDLILQAPEDFKILAGDDNLGLPIIALGGRGIVSVASNIIPRRMADFVKAALNNDMEETRRMHYQLLPLFRALFLETNPIPVKYGLSLMGKMEENYRLPLCSMTKEHKLEFKQVMKALGIIKA